MFHILYSVPRFFTSHIRVTGYDVKALMAEHQIRSLSILENDQMTGIVALGTFPLRKILVKKRKQHNENGIKQAW